MLVLASAVMDMRNELRAQDARWTDEVLMAYSRYYVKQSQIKQRGRASFQDGSRSKVYKAEWAFQRKAGSGKQFATLKDAQQYVQKVISSKTWTALGGSTSVRLEQKKDMGSRSRTAGLAHHGGLIVLCPRYGMNEYTVLHELAHQCGHMHHDLTFRLCIVDLVSRFMGKELGQMLKAAFREGGLKMSKRAEKTPQAWLEAYCRAAVAREKL